MQYEKAIMLSIVIPVYNGAELLSEYLPVLLKVLEDENFPYEIIVVDDGSNKILEIKYPHTRVLRLNKNYGFAHACNAGAKESQYPRILFLNTDVKVAPGFLPPLLKHFDDQTVFAVSPRIIIPEENNYNEAVTAAYLRGSNLIFKIGTKKDLLHPQEILYACGAALLVDKDKFWEIGGFDELYSPFYWEDLDLSYQAWKRGYRVIYEPKSTVFHMHSKTIKSFRRHSFIQGISMRNRYLFRWKNFTDPWLVFLMLLELFTLKFLNPNPTEWIGYFKALRKLKEVLAHRKEAQKYARLTDREVFAKFKGLI